MAVISSDQCPASAAADDADNFRPDNKNNPGHHPNHQPGHSEDRSHECNHECNQYLSAYLSHLTSERQLSARTIEHYARDLQQLFKMQDDVPLLATTSPQIRNCVVKLHSQALDPRSIARKLSAWRGFFQWLLKQDRIAVNPVESIKAPKRKKLLPKALSTEDAIGLVATAPQVAARAFVSNSKHHAGQDRKSNTAEAMRQSHARSACDHAMFELLYSSGLRVSELANLDWRYSHEQDYVSQGWIDLEAGEVNVTGKGNKKRTVPVGRHALQALTTWLARRADLQKDTLEIQHRAALFLSTQGKRISVRAIQLHLQAHARQLGVLTSVHPHVLRHSFASHVLQSSGDLRAVQDMLGHASISSTQIYTALDFQRLAQVYDATHPRAKKIQTGLKANDKKELETELQSHIKPELKSEK